MRNRWRSWDLTTRRWRATSPWRAAAWSGLSVIAAGLLYALASAAFHRNAAHESALSYVLAGCTFSLVAGALRWLRLRRRAASPDAAAGEDARPAG